MGSSHILRSSSGSTDANKLTSSKELLLGFSKLTSLLPSWQMEKADCPRQPPVLPGPLYWGLMWAFKGSYGKAGTPAPTLSHLGELDLVRTTPFGSIRCVDFAEYYSSVEAFKRWTHICLCVITIPVQLNLFSTSDVPDHLELCFPPANNAFLMEKSSQSLLLTI